MVRTRLCISYFLTALDLDFPELLPRILKQEKLCKRGSFQNFKCPKFCHLARDK